MTTEYLEWVVIFDTSLQPVVYSIHVEFLFIATRATSHHQLLKLEYCPHCGKRLTSSEYQDTSTEHIQRLVDPCEQLSVIIILLLRTTEWYLLLIPYFTK